MSKQEDSYYELDPLWTDPKRLKKEREKAKKLRKSQWWLNQIQKRKCHYCEKNFPPEKLTMDHIVPLARGGSSTPGNVVPSCNQCNQNKKLEIPVEKLFKKLIS